MAGYVVVKQLKMSRRMLRQLRVTCPTALRPELLKADKIVGWFYGNKALGSQDYGREPYILCVDIHGSPYLVRVSSGYLCQYVGGSTLKVAGFEIEQVFVA